VVRAYGNPHHLLREQVTGEGDSTLGASRLCESHKFKVRAEDQARNSARTNERRGVETLMLSLCNISTDRSQAISTLRRHRYESAILLACHFVTSSRASKIMLDKGLLLVYYHDRLPGWLRGGTYTAVPAHWRALARATEDCNPFCPCDSHKNTT